MNSAIKLEMLNNIFGEYPKKRFRKKTIIIAGIAGVLGFPGFHYFYLRKYGNGLFVPVVAWHIAVFLGALTQSMMVAYPLLLSFSGYFMYKYSKMPDDVFDQKYNHYLKCSACGRRLHLANKATFGQGKLNDGSRLCYACYMIVQKHDRQIVGFSKAPFDAGRAMEILEQALPEKRLLPSYYTLQKISSTAILAELEDISSAAISLYINIIVDEQLLEQYTLLTDDNEPVVFFKTYLIYDLGQITKMVCNGSLDIKCTETFSFVLITMYLWSHPELLFLDVAKNVFRSAQNLVKFKEIFDPLKEIVEGVNLYQLNATLQVRSDENEKTSAIIPLALLPVLKKLEPPLFESYQCLLHHFAECIIFNNGQNVEQQKEKLKQVHTRLNGSMQES